jgi:hypothetical protein
MPNYIWPLSGTTTAPDMNTSFGPRINKQRRDFHDGIDLKAPLGAPVLAMRSGTVHRAGPGGTHGFRSRHVVLKVDDPIHGVIYLVHVHLASIAGAMTAGAHVTQGQVIGTVGDDDASYSHLHFEFRKAKPFEKYSVHPLEFLPYVNTANFTAPRCDRFNRLNTLLAARLRFDAPDRAEGDLQRIAVDLFSDSALIATRTVDFNDKTTINEGIGDELLFVNDIGVEGYQRSNLAEDGRGDLQYGILVRNLPANCRRLRGRVIDVGGTVAQGTDFPIPNQTAADTRVDFEDGLMPPAGWRAILSGPTGATTTVNDPAAAYAGSRGMRCTVSATDEGGARAACIESSLPEKRFEWMVKGRFRLKALQLADGQSICLLQFQTGDDQLSVAGRIKKLDNGLRVGLLARRPDGSLEAEESQSPVALRRWHEWKLHVRRVGTRETTAILSLDDVERVRLNWDTSSAEPRSVRAGIARISQGGTATVLADGLRVTEATAQT